MQWWNCKTQNITLCDRTLWMRNCQGWQRTTSTKLGAKFKWLRNTPFFDWNCLLRWCNNHIIYLGAKRGYNKRFNDLRVSIAMQGQPTSSVDCGASKGLTHIENVTGHMSAVTWKHANNTRIDYAICRGKWASNTSTTHGHPFDTTTEVHVVFGTTPTAIRQMKIKS